MEETNRYKFRQYYQIENSLEEDLLYKYEKIIIINKY
jgi:hypothetical protein